MAVMPNPGTPIIPIAQPMEVDGPELSGRAIAFQFTGTTMLYLVVNQKNPGPPVWIEADQIQSTYLSDSRR
jgi:hypothetical protein